MRTHGRVMNVDMIEEGVEVMYIFKKLSYTK
jgi:hypothetical protein